MSTKASDMGVGNVHQSRPIGAIPPKPKPAQLAAQSKAKPAPKKPAKRGK